MFGQKHTYYKMPFATILGVNSHNESDEDIKFIIDSSTDLQEVELFARFAGAYFFRKIVKEHKEYLAVVLTIKNDVCIESIMKAMRHLNDVSCRFNLKDCKCVNKALLKAINEFIPSVNFIEFIDCKITDDAWDYLAGNDCTFIWLQFGPNSENLLFNLVLLSSTLKRDDIVIQTFDRTFDDCDDCPDDCKCDKNIWFQFSEKSGRLQSIRKARGLPEKICCQYN